MRLYFLSAGTDQPCDMSLSQSQPSIFSVEDQVSLQVWQIRLSCRGSLPLSLHPISPPPPPPAADLSPPASMSPEGEPSWPRCSKSHDGAACRLTLTSSVLQSVQT